MDVAEVLDVATAREPRAAGALREVAVAGGAAEPLLGERPPPCPGGWDAGVQRETLVVTTDDPKQPVIEIPVQAVVQTKITKAPPVVNH